MNLLIDNTINGQIPYIPSPFDSRLATTDSSATQIRSIQAVSGSVLDLTNGWILMLLLSISSPHHTAPLSKQCL